MDSRAREELENIAESLHDIAVRTFSGRAQLSLQILSGLLAGGQGYLCEEREWYVNESVTLADMLIERLEKNE